MTVTTNADQPRGLARWIVYQRERFPVLAHGPLIAAFSSGAVCYSAQLRAASIDARPSVLIASLVVAFVSCLLFFFQLRVSDEFKDHEEDTRWRPYRPVPRGLVTLRELGSLAVVAMAIQVALAVWLTPRLLGPLLLVWGYAWLMTKEFWVKEWLASRPLTVLWSHMLIMPLIDLYATACDWLAAGAFAPPGLGLAWFLVASFFNGMVVEIGRKIRSSTDEETGVQTYSAVWGPRRAVAGWLFVMALTTGFAVLAAHAVGATWVVLGILGALALVAIGESVRFLRAMRPGQGKRLETLSGIWTIAMYLGVGVVPFFLAR
ncbi:MAG TPA: UbiA family prenyltransferase [Gemmatimonadaceae bacterium]|nr:UbiA family prenyltransferase [Gemmatimonadaceae bacterium]